ncbi:hypothetical protein PIB30_027471 [Stylosanthes scabra]|uniref:KIB1-4 beta-propeller domain-containing protein n=1 Tax=Stylosanthes scabra TaxID=79078 RepID=A0ABU6QAV4_9FABA|nr:hypothetical protein [Stylosanthes scabra]
MNCRATCRSWRKASESVLSSQLPLLLSFSSSFHVYSGRSLTPHSTGYIGILSAPWNNHDSSVLTVTLPRTTRHYDIISRVLSVPGRLTFNQFHCVSNNKEVQTFSELSFLNPVSRARFKLPKLFLLSGGCPQNMKQRLAFIRFKQGSWIEIESMVETNEIFYEIAVDDHDKLYALAFKHNTSVVFVLNLKDHHRHERMVMLNHIENINFAAFYFGFASHSRRHRLTIDTSTGELFLVRHVVHTGCECCIYSIRTKEFRVYKLERSSLRWCEVFDIGDRFLLWDYTASVSVVSAKGLIRVPEEFRGGNCIIFCNEDGGDSKGVFFLDDRTITCFPIIKRSVSWDSVQNMWFTPAP